MFISCEQYTFTHRLRRGVNIKGLILTISIVLIVFLTFAQVSASDDSQDILNETQSEKTFDSIQDKINSSQEHDTILIEGTYSGLGTQIDIDKPVTIRGVGSDAKLNGQSKSRILNIASDNVTLENLIFAGGKGDMVGGAIYCTADNLKIINCRFIQNSVDRYGGAVMCEGDNAEIIDCEFSKNRAEFTGGAFELWGSNCRVDGCTFTDNIGCHAGGAVSWVGNNGTLSNSVFEYSLSSSTASLYGGEVVWMGENGRLEKSIFYPSMALKSAEAIYWKGGNGSVEYCIFSDTSNEKSLYAGNPEYLGPNYWGENIASDDGFYQRQMIYYNETLHAPKNWVNIQYSDDTIGFALNNGSSLDNSLPDWKVSYKNSQVIISDNAFQIKRNTFIESGDMTVYNNGEQMRIILKDEDGRPLSGKQISININGVNRNVQTDNSGIAMLRLDKLPVGTHYISISFNGDGKYFMSSKIVKITVKKQKTKLKIKTNAKRKTIKVTLKSQFKKPMAKCVLKLTVNKKTYKAKTSKKGVASFKLKLKNAKKYGFIVKFKGSKYYKGVSKRGTIKLS